MQITNCYNMSSNDSVSAHNQFFLCDHNHLLLQINLYPQINPQLITSR